jgi:hypothetical protein
MSRRYNRATMWDQLERQAEGGGRIARREGEAVKPAKSGGLFSGLGRITR